MATKRKHKRFIKRCKTEFTANDVTKRGISSDFSMTGLFIRTMHPMPPDTVLDITVHLPDGSPSRLTAIVRRATRTPLGRAMGIPEGRAYKNGMGVEIIERDANYLHFIGSLLTDHEAGPEAPAEGKPAAGETDPVHAGPMSTKELLIQLIRTQQALINLLTEEGVIRKADFMVELKRLEKK